MPTPVLTATRAAQYVKESSGRVLEHDSSSPWQRSSGKTVAELHLATQQYQRVFWGLKESGVTMEGGPCSKNLGVGHGGWARSIFEHLSKRIPRVPPRGLWEALMCIWNAGVAHQEEERMVVPSWVPSSNMLSLMFKVQLIWAWMLTLSLDLVSLAFWPHPPGLQP
jgi:hypothetical protein